MEIINFFQSGGAFMYPILFIFAFGVAIAIERFIYIVRTDQKTNDLWRQLIPMLKAKDFARAAKLVQNSNTPLGLVLSYGFARQQQHGNRDMVETAMEEGMMEAMPNLERRTPFLATFANIATLLGLLGTIIGLIQAFTAVAAADPAEKAELLSASIAVAMNTTAFGLIAAIPLILIHSYIAARTGRLTDKLEMVSVKCLNLMVEE